MRPEGVPFLGHGMSLPGGTEQRSHPDTASPDLGLTVCPLLCLVLGCDLKCPCPSCYDAQSQQHRLAPTLPAAHPPWTSLTFDIDLEAPAVLTTRGGHTAFPEPTVPKSQTWHLELSCRPLRLHNGLGGLRETGKGTKTVDIPWQLHVCLLD